MKILLAHNYYGSSAPSGENTVFAAEKKLLEDNGHEVVEYARHSDEIRKQGAWGALKGAASTPWNPFSKADLGRVLKAVQPDVMHVHNFFPLLSPSVFHAARGMKTAVVFTLHNYRVFCAAGIPMRGGLPCTECHDRKSVLPALKSGCYRNSRAATVPMALMIALHRWLGTWQRHVDAFIALTEFQKSKLVAAGLPADRVYIKPHFYADPPAPMPWQGRKARVVYIGRLGREKGLHVLLDAWQKWGREAPELELIGDGPEKTALARNAARNSASAIRFLGQLPFAQAQQRLAKASLLILPSLCFEGFPMVIGEAFALGVPVAASHLGSMPCVVNDGVDGVLFAPGDSDDLLEKVSALWKEQAMLARMGGNARAEFERKYTAEVNYKMLMEIYSSAIGTRAARLNNSPH